MVRLVILLMLSACIASDDPLIIIPVEPPPADPISCPKLNWGVVLCSSLAPECGKAAEPGQEDGLHCLPGFEDDLRTPCFCVGARTNDYWCIREEPDR